MDITAALRWGSSNKSISYMIIDEDFNIRTPPKIERLDRYDWDGFKNNADEFIRSFFSEINKLCRSKKDCHIFIEYKIVASGSPVKQFDAKMNKPTDKTEFVRSKFVDYFEKAKKKHESIELAEQLRSDLKKPLLSTFKESLKSLGLVEDKRQSSYVCHLWALALHITKSSYRRKVAKLRDGLLKQEPRIAKEMMKHESK